MSLPLVNHDFPEDDCVLHEGEEHEEHAGQQPHLQRRHCVAHRDPRPETNLEITFLIIQEKYLTFYKISTIMFN